MERGTLGEFEELVLILVAALKQDAYGAMIVEQIENRLKRNTNVSAVHVALYRMQDKGLVKSSFGGATLERGGRRKRIYTITSAGLALLHSMQESRVELWKMVPSLKLS